jgi:hypothetical protein
LFLRNAHWLGSSVEPGSNIALDAKKDNVDQNRSPLTHIKKTITVVSVNGEGSGDYFDDPTYQTAHLERN